MNAYKILILSISVLLGARQASAYTYYECEFGANIDWIGDEFELDIDGGSFPPGAAEAFARVVSEINRSPGASVYVDIGNSDNTVKFGELPFGLLGQTEWIGWCPFGGGGFMIDADIKFNVLHNWYFEDFETQDDYFGSRFYFDNVAAHEILHAMPLGHENRWISTMNTEYPNGSPMGQYADYHIHGDDVNGIHRLYGGGQEKDYYLSYYDPDPINNVFSGYIALAHGSARQGDPISVRYAAGNRGYNQTVQLLADVFLSTDDVIEDSDILIGTEAFFITFPGHGRIEHTVWIPIETPPGEYHLGVKLRENGIENPPPDLNPTNDTMILRSNFQVIELGEVPLVDDFSASDGESPDHVRLTWSGSEEHSVVFLYRNSQPLACTGVPFAQVNDPGIDGEYLDTTAIQDQTYYYSARPRRGASDHGVCTPLDAGIAADILPPTPVWATGDEFGTSDQPGGGPDLPQNGRIKISWEPVPGADGYHVYYTGGWASNCANTGVPTITVYGENRSFAYHTPLMPGIRYKYAVTAFKGSNESPVLNLDDYCGVGYYNGLARPNLFGVDTSTPGKAKLTWSKVPGAETYRIYRSTFEGSQCVRFIRQVQASGDEEPVERFTDSVFGTVNPPQSGVQYYYSVKAEDPGPLTGACSVSQPAQIRAPRILNHEGPEGNVGFP